MSQYNGIDTNTDLFVWRSVAPTRNTKNSSWWLSEPWTNLEDLEDLSKTFFLFKTHIDYTDGNSYISIYVLRDWRHWAYQSFSDFQRGNVEGLEETGNTDWSIPGGTLERAGNSHGHWREGETTRSGFRGRIPTYGYESCMNWDDPPS